MLRIQCKEKPNCQIFFNARHWVKFYYLKVVNIVVSYDFHRQRLKIRPKKTKFDTTKKHNLPIMLSRHLRTLEPALNIPTWILLAWKSSCIHVPVLAFCRCRQPAHTLQCCYEKLMHFLSVYAYKQFELEVRQTFMYVLQGSWMISSQG